MAAKPVDALAIELSTTACGLGGRNQEGQEFFTSIPMRGATKWQDMPAFDLRQIPGMIKDGMILLAKQMGFPPEDWRQAFAGGGALCVVCRQHDLGIFGRNGLPLIPALSWQCTEASREVERLRMLKAEEVVGPIHARFALPKLMMILDREPELRTRISSVMLTGDWVNSQLKHRQGRIPRMSTSDGKSNGFVIPATGELAEDVITAVGLNPMWFPQPINSSEIQGAVDYSTTGLFAEISEALFDWSICPALGDNHASALGTGATESDLETAVVSAGTSGTATRICDLTALLAGKTASFEFFPQKRLLLAMMADCGSWWTRFKRSYGQGKGDSELADLASKAKSTLQVRQYPNMNGGFREEYPDGFDELPLEGKAASALEAIARTLAKQVEIIMAEVKGENAPKIQRVVLTGGLAQAKTFQLAFRAAVQMIRRGTPVLMSAKEGPMAFQTGVYGGLIRALVANGTFSSLEKAVAALCPVREI